MNDIIITLQEINDRILTAIEQYKNVVDRIKEEQNIYYIQYGIIQLNRKINKYSEIEKYRLIKNIFLKHKDDFKNFRNINPDIFEMICEIVTAWWIKWLAREENDWVLFEYFLNILESELDAHIEEIIIFNNNTIENPTDIDKSIINQKYYKAFSLLSGISLFAHDYLIFSTQSNLYSMTSIVGALALLLPALRD